MNSSRVSKGCTFCEQYIQGTVVNYWASEWGKKFEQKTDVIYETNDTVIVAGLGAISEGYILLVPRAHYFSVAQLPNRLLDDIQQLKIRVRSFLEKKYGSVIFFEHGMVIPSKRAGACIDHVHLNAFPCKFDIRPSLQEKFTEKKITTFNEIKSLAETEKSYIFLENQIGEMFIYETPDPIPSQFVRKIWARNMGKPSEWDWALFVNEENVSNTIEAFQSFQNEMQGKIYR